MAPKDWKRDPVTKQFKAPSSAHDKTPAPEPAPQEQASSSLSQITREIVGLLVPLRPTAQLQVIAATICLLDSNAAVAALSSFRESMGASDKGP